jgi:antitoxin CptB
MNDTNRRKQILYRANHRGIKEMDIILGGYADAHVMSMSGAELNQFEAIMNEHDRDLLMWFTGEVVPPDHMCTPMFEAILSHAGSKALTRGNG